MADNEKKNDKGVWEKGDLEVLKVVYKGKVVKTNKPEKDTKKKSK